MVFPSNLSAFSGTRSCDEKKKVAFDATRRFVLFFLRGSIVAVTQLEIHCGRLALGPFRLSKLGMAPVLVSFSVGMGPFGMSGSSKFRRGTVAGPYFRSPFFG